MSKGSDELELRRTIHQFLHEKVEILELPEPLLVAGSLDSQIDDFLMSAEKDANEVAKEDEEEEISAERVSRLIGMPLLNEQEDEEEGKEEATAEVTPPLDVEVFAQDVARLTKNYDNLLDVPSTIVNRAINFLLKNYDQTTVNQFKEILSVSFDIELKTLGKTYDDPERPFAAGALGASGGGGV
jgi:hypothetical protein